MPFVLSELIEHLKRWDETYLLERLNITSEQLVDRFTDLIEDKFESLEEEALEEFNEDDGTQDQDC